MARFRCTACRGEYDDLDAQGVPYFHACAPVPNPTFQPDPSQPAFDPNPTRERPNRRDENPLDNLEVITGKYFLLVAGRLQPVVGLERAAGAGRTPT